MTKYSAGEWEVRGTSVLAGGIRISQSGYRGAACVQVERAFEETRKANARLISMSPKMLKFIKKYADVVKIHDQDVYDMYLEALDLIQKATGDE